MPKMKIDGPEAKIRIIKAARKLFFKHGFDEVSLIAIAKEARVSKTSLYEQVGDKTAILKAVVLEENKRFMSRECDPPKTKEEYRNAFIEFGENLVSFLSEKNIIRFDQVMLGQAIKKPKISKTFYEFAYEETHSFLTFIIQYGQDNHFTDATEDAEFLAELILLSWPGKAYHMALYGYKDSKHKNIKTHIERVLKVVLHI